MTRDELYEIFEEIKSEYPFFDVGEENFERHWRYLQDFSFEDALANVIQHIKTTPRRQPGIGDIRGQLGDMVDSQRSKDETATYFGKLEQWSRNSSPPPPGFMDEIRAKVMGDTGTV
ncbi:hypothetical protein [Cohnella boryungensis]|uniref:Replicative helicase inhibitor G39P N-terminal domain-containing protein n=1 Tax=Cohnella boryungensis TaxID=768479 RepID=A0ABV8SDX1_9BACL